MRFDIWVHSNRDAWLHVNFTSCAQIIETLMCMHYNISGQEKKLFGIQIYD